MSFNRWSNKYIVWYSYNEYSSAKKYTVDTPKTVTEFQNIYTDWKKPDQKKCISYDFIFISSI